MPSNNCSTLSLSPYQGDWNEIKVRHLYRKFGFGATLQDVSNALTMNPSELIDQLIDDAASIPQPVPPYWANWTYQDYEDDGNDLQYEHFEELRELWLQRGFDYPNHMKLTLFWHDHFSTEYDVYNCTRYAWEYFALINQMAFGNFRLFVENMGKTGAMLSYLNGNENRAEEPNENYARELMELFTLGEGNGYTQTDIEQVARALTGFRANMYQCTAPYFDNNRYDNEAKTIFGQTGNFGYDEVHELIFTLRAQETAKYICSKLYQLYVYFDPQEEVVNQLAQTFIDNNWEIVPVLKQLLKSEHFFDEAFIGSGIKSPIDLMLNMIKPIGLDLNIDVTEGMIDYIDYSSYRVGLDLFNPPNVAGWPGHRTWLNENALTYRWTYCNTLIRNYLEDSGKEKLRQLALTLANESNDPRIIVTVMMEHFLSTPLDDDLIDVGVLYLSAGIPENYFLDGSWNLYWGEAPDQLVNLIGFFIQIPEFQLA